MNNNKESIGEVKLKAFYLSSALNQSNVELRLPFGMKRQLRPLNIMSPVVVGVDEDMRMNVLRADDYDLKLNIEPKQQVNNKIKFINQRILSTSMTSTTGIDDNCLKFDPSAILFFKGNEMVRTNLTSNAHGTVSNDKNYLSGVLNHQGCWLMSLPDISNFNLPEIQNNKLRAMKYLEFVTQEWDGGIDERFGEEVELIALNVEETDRFVQLGGMKAWILVSQKAQMMKEMYVKIYDKTGKLKMEICTRDVRNTFKFTRIPVIIDNGDTIALIKGGSPMLTDVNFKLEDDYESKMDYKALTGVKAIIVSRVHFKQEFDALFHGDRRDNVISVFSNTVHNPLPSIEYECHLDTKIGDIVNEPKPIPFGCTTRHSVIYRKGYLAALHHDASKINRFTDTINYIIRKLINESNLNQRLEQEGSSGGILKRISDIQYFAYLIKAPCNMNKKGFFLGLAGGAKCILMSNDLKKYKIFEFPILNFIPTDEIQAFPNVILLSPHFPSFLIKSVPAATSVKDWLKGVLMVSGHDAQNFKLSMAYFTIRFE